MCGLVGVYNRVAPPANDQDKLYPAKEVINILRRLEYRGYDSAGILGVTDTSVFYSKVVGRVSKLEEMFAQYMNIEYNMAIGHTRWATNGGCTEANCHPHTSMKGLVKLVHNGIIENAKELKIFLTKEGYQFYGETDSEILANYLEYWLEKKLDVESKDVGQTAFNIVADILSEVEGTYALVIIVDHPEHDIMFGFHRGNPLVFGKSQFAYYLCSDLNALNGYVREGLPLDVGCNVMIVDDVVTYSQKPTKFIQLAKGEDYDLAGFESFTRKEIICQSESLNRTLSGRIEDGEVRISAFDDNSKFLKSVKKITIVAEGTSYHAGLIGKEYIESMTDVEVKVELASEYLDKMRPVSDNELVILISQSGETADVIRCAKSCKCRNMTTMAITNGVESQLSRMVDFGVYLRCGVEIGVASTKAFTSTVLVLSLLACKLARFDRMTQSQVDEMFKDVIPKGSDIMKLEAKVTKKIDELKEKIPLEKIRSFIFLGKCEYKALAMEAALKMNELAYIPSLSYSVGSLKHGPLGLIDKDIVVVVLDADPRFQADTDICINQVTSRSAIKMAGFGINYFKTRNRLKILLNTAIQCQLLAYHVAKELGREIDKPRNLAKSVTVK